MIIGDILRLDQKIIHILSMISKHLTENLCIMLEKQKLKETMNFIIFLLIQFQKHQKKSIK